MATTNTQVNGAGSPKSLDWTTFYNTINGQLESTAKTRHSINPATGEPGPEVPLSTREDVDRAVAAAKVAFKTWSLVPWNERRDAILAFSKAIQDEQEGFSQMLTKEQGKPVEHSCHFPSHIQD